MIRPHLETLLPIKVVSVKTQDAKQVLDHYCRDDLRQQTAHFKTARKADQRDQNAAKENGVNGRKKKAHVLFKLTRLTAMH